MNIWESLFPLLFVIVIILLSVTLDNTNYGYLLSKEIPISYLLFMDDLKLYGKTERELQPLVHTVRIILKILASNLEWTNAEPCP